MNNEKKPAGKMDKKTKKFMKEFASKLKNSNTWIAVTGLSLSIAFAGLLYYLEIPERVMFYPWMSKKDRAYLEQKIGFQYRYTVFDPTDPENKRHTEYDFSIGMGLFSRPYETLMETTYNGVFFDSSSVSMYDDNRDNDADSVRIKDNINHTEATIQKKLFGLKVEGMPEDEGRRLFDYYRNDYKKFKHDHHLDRKIGDYQRKVEIHQFR